MHRWQEGRGLFQEKATVQLLQLIIVMSRLKPLPILRCATIIHPNIDLSGECRPAVIYLKTFYKICEIPGKQAIQQLSATAAVRQRGSAGDRAATMPPTPAATDRCT